MNKNDLKKFAEKFNARAERERLMISLILVALLGCIWIYLIFLPLSQKNKDLALPVTTANKALDQMNQQYAYLLKVDKNPPFADLEKQKENLMAQFAAMKNNPNFSKKTILSYDQLVPTLQAILSTDPELTISHLEEMHKENKVLVEFTGSYFACLSFFQRLEQQPWYFFYDEFHYKVTEYPEADITLILHTLNLKEGQ